MSTLRLFIAVPCRPSPGLQTVLAALAEHRDALKPVAADQLHVTLRFLGEQPEERVAALAEAVERAAAKVSAMSLTFSGLTTLPPGERRLPRTVCVGFEDARPLHALHDALNGQLAQLDPPLPPPNRPFRAHLTLARVKSPPRQKGRAASRVRDLVAGHAQTELGAFVGEAAHLIASRLTPAGPVHRTLHATALPSPHAER